MIVMFRHASHKPVVRHRHSPSFFVNEQLCTIRALVHSCHDDMSMLFCLLVLTYILSILASVSAKFWVPFIVCMCMNVLTDYTTTFTAIHTLHAIHLTFVHSMKHSIVKNLILANTICESFNICENKLQCPSIEILYIE